MESVQLKVKKIKVKKPKPPSFKNRLIRAIKKGYISNKWFWNIVIFSALIVLMSGALLSVWLFPPPKGFNPNSNKSSQQDIQDMLDKLNKKES